MARRCGMSMLASCRKSARKLQVVPAIRCYHTSIPLSLLVTVARKLIMRNLIIVPFVALSNVRQILSFPGIRQEQPTASDRQRTGKPFFVTSNDNGAAFLKSPLQRSPQLSPLGEPELIEFIIDEKKLQKLRKKRKARFAVSLAAISGALDVICFRRFGCFAHMMTGNTVRCLTAITELRWKEAMFFVALVSMYTAGSAGFRMIDIWNTRRRENGKSMSTFSILSSILLPVFIMSEALVHMFQLPTAMVAAMWSFGFGMVNASTHDATAAVTNAVTGHWIKFGLAAADGIMLGERRKGSRLSYHVLGATAASVCITSLAAQWMSHRPAVVSSLPPVGGLIGFAYFALFQWYAREPRVAQHV